MVMIEKGVKQAREMSKFYGDMPKNLNLKVPYTKERDVGENNDMK